MPYRLAIALCLDYLTIIQEVFPFCKQKIPPKLIPSRRGFLYNTYNFPNPHKNKESSSFWRLQISGINVIIETIGLAGLFGRKERGKEMYSFQSRIRYSETDSEGRLSLFSLLDYFQDCSTFQSEDLGVGLGYLKQRHMAWVLSSWQIVIDRYPRLCEDVEVGTFPYEFRSFLGYRNFFLKTMEREWLARANSLWSLLNMDTGKPAVPPAEMVAKYALEERLPMDYAPRKIAIPEGGRFEEPIVVRKHHLDTNHHVNNAQYVNMALELLPEGAFPEGIRMLRVEYKKQAFLEDVLLPYVVQEEGRVLASLRDGAGNVYVNVEFR